MSKTDLTGLEPSLGGTAARGLLVTGLEPALGGERRFDAHIWARLLDPRWVSKESLIAGLPVSKCEIYARLLIQVLPTGSVLNEKLDDGAALSGHLSTDQRAAVARVLGLIGARTGKPFASTLVEPLSACLHPNEVEIVRVEAARAVGLLGDSQAESILLNNLAGGDWRFRIAAIQALGAVGGAEAVSFLTRLQRYSESLNESMAALESLGILAARLGDPYRRRVYDLLVHVFVRGDNLQRGASARALGLLGDKDALDLVIQTAIHGRGDLQCAAVQALGMFADAQAVPPLIGVLTSGAYHARQDAVNALIQIGQAAITPVLAILRHPEPGVRRGAVEVLGKVGAQEASRSLIERLDDPSPEVRQSVVTALGMIRGEGAVDALIHALEDPDPGVRKEAAMMLSSVPDERVVGPLCLALWDPDMTVRWFAAYTLGVLKDARAVRPLCQALSDRSDNVAHTAADSLVKIGDLAVSGLFEYARTGDAESRRLVVDIIERIESPLARAALADLPGAGQASSPRELV